MKSKLYVPVMNSNVTPKNRSLYLRALQDAHADTVFIAFEREPVLVGDDNAYELLCQNIEYFEKNGYEVGVWIQSFGFGFADADFYPGIEKYTRIRSVTGNETFDANCPEDENFVSDFLNGIRKITECGAKMIMLDDDLCMSVRPGIGCFCDKHIKLLGKELNETLNDKDLPKLLFCGKTNKYRKAWLKVQKNSILDFARKVRDCVDKIDDNIRMGFCAGFTSWDIEGADALEVTRILAGNNKPFLRFTGAPYWVAACCNRFSGQKLGAVNEFARLQEYWCRNSGIEIFAEADSYPRPRYNIPASLLECFDTAVVANGGMGDLKYLLDYYSSPEYETGYVKHHLKNEALRQFIRRCFDNKKNFGVQVVEKMHKISDMILPEEFIGETKLMDVSHSYGASMLSSNGIPITYDTNSKAALAFNVNVDELDVFPEKLIIDISAAEILKCRGIDTGLISSKYFDASFRYEETEDEGILLTKPFARYCKCELSEKAEVLSWFTNGKERIPAAYLYNNGQTQFLVFAFDAYSPSFDSNLFASYMRQKQIMNFVGEGFCFIKNEPWIYQLCKKSKNETAILFENLWEDPLFDFDIWLDKEYSDVTFFGADGVLENDKLRITSEISPYGMFAVLLK